MTEKKEYKKPKLAHVKVIAEEAVLTNCKTNVQQGPNAPECVIPGAQCNEPGS